MSKPAPERIYLQTDDEGYEEANALGDLTWCADKINETDVEYVRVTSAKPFAWRWRDTPESWAYLEEDPKIEGAMRLYAGPPGGEE